MTSIVRFMHTIYQFHRRLPVRIIVISVFIFLPFRSVNQILTAIVIPLFKERICLIMYRHKSDTVFRLALYDIKTMIFNIDIFSFQIKQLAYSDAAINKHQNDLNICIDLLIPKPFYFFSSKYIPISLVRILVFMLCYLNIL